MGFRLVNIVKNIGDEKSSDCTVLQSEDSLSYDLSFPKLIPADYPANKARPIQAADSDTPSLPQSAVRP